MPYPENIIKYPKVENYMNISIVLLNWNGANYLDGCLESIRNQSEVPFELILVDNGSTDNSLDLALKSDIKSLRIIETGTNLGFAKGMNRGIVESHGDLVLLLNLDVVLESNFLRHCREAFEADPGIGILGGKELAWEKGILTDILVSQGGFFLRRRMQGITNVRLGDGYCFGPHGSFPCLRRKALNDSMRIWGYFYDPKFGTGWEDLDLWFRLHMLGWKCYYRDDLIAWHVGSSSADEKKRLIDKSLEYQKRIFRNRWFLLIKNVFGKTLVSILPSIIAAELSLIPYYLYKSPESIYAITKAFIEVIVSLPALLSERRKAIRWAKDSKNDMINYFIRF